MPTPNDRATTGEVETTLAVVAENAGWLVARTSRALGSGNVEHPPTLLCIRGGELLALEVATTDASRGDPRKGVAKWFPAVQALGGEGMRVSPTSLGEALDRLRQEPKS